MNSQFSKEKQAKSSSENLVRPIHRNDFHRRRFVEMKRRSLSLQSRRSQLQKELKSIENCIFSLDKQLQNYSDFEKYSIGGRRE